MRKTIIACLLAGCAHLGSDMSSSEDARDPGGPMDSLRDSDPKVRARAAVALGRIGAPQATPKLRSALGDRDSRVRTAAAFALGIVEDTESERQLVTQLSQATTEPEREAIVAALGRVGGELAAEVLARIGDARALTALGIIGYRKQHIPPNSSTRVIEKLTAEDAAVRWAAAYALFRLPMPFEQAVDGLKAACADPDASVRAMAIRALAVHGPDELDTLDKALSDEDWHVRVQAVRALAASGRGAAKLAPRLDEAMGVHTLVAAFEAMRPEAQRTSVQEAAARFKDHTNMRVRCAAAVIVDLLDGVANATRGCGPDEATVTRDAGALRKLWDSGDVKVQIAVAEKVARMVRERQGGSRLLTDIVEEVKDPGATAAVADAVRGAAEAGWRNPETAVHLAKRLRRQLPLETRISVIGALGALGEKTAEGPLEEALSHHNAAVREAARKALEALQADFPRSVTVDKPPRAKGNVAEVQTHKMRATIVTEKGPIVVELFTEDAPRTVASFAHLARTNFYKDLTFHRVVPDFVIQGGDPRGDGYGGADYSLRCEVNDRQFGPGTVGMALAGKDTGSSQFFITHSRQPHLDGRYTLFGQVVEGMDVVDKIEKGDLIRNVKIEATKIETPK